MGGQPPDQGQQVVDGEGFAQQVGAGIRSEGGLEILQGLPAGEDERNPGARAADALEQLHAGAAGRALVAEHQVEGLALEDLPGPVSGGGRADVGSGRGQGALQHVEQEGLVLGHEDPQSEEAFGGV